MCPVVPRDDTRDMRAMAVTVVGLFQRGVEQDLGWNTCCARGILELVAGAYAGVDHGDTDARASGRRPEAAGLDRLRVQRRQLRRIDDRRLPHRGIVVDEL